MGHSDADFLCGQSTCEGGIYIPDYNCQVRRVGQKQSLKGDHNPGGLFRVRSRSDIQMNVRAGHLEIIENSRDIRSS